MGLLNLMFGNFADGCREAMRTAYEKHYSLAKAGSAPVRMDPHHAGLFGALGTRYKARGILPASPEVVLWSELAPFCLMSKEESLEVLTEYVLWQEQPDVAKKAWLSEKINQALSKHASAGDDHFTSLAPVALLNNVKWCDLLDPAIKSTLLGEAAKL